VKSNSLYLGGLAAGAIYLIGDIIGGMITPNYDFITNAASELIQTGAPDRKILSVFFFLHAVAIIMAGIAIIQSHTDLRSRRLYYGGILLIIIGTSHALSGTVFAMDPVGSEPTSFGITHLVLVGISVIAIFILFPLSASGFIRQYGWHGLSKFTYFCFAIILISGISSPYVINNNLPFMGLTERITGYIFYTWLFIISLRLRKSGRMAEIN
jgi:hypothetical protein